MKKLRNIILMIVLVLFAMGPILASADPYEARPHEWRDVQTFQKAAIFNGSATFNGSLFPPPTNYNKVYYVDGNMSNNYGDGASWDTAYSSLVTALAASHANIAETAGRNWAARNVIYVKGDEIEEDFTALADKTDVVGIGSNDGYSKAGIKGSWIIPDTVQYKSTRFYNIMFNEAGATPIIDLDTQSGTEFHNCLFDAEAATTIGIYAEETQFLVIDNCEFSRVSSSLGFSTSVISILQDTDAIYGYKITNNLINGAAIGIDWNETESYNCLIAGNILYSTAMTIDCESDDVVVVNNRLMTAVDCDSYAIDTGFDFDLKNAAGNILMGSGSGAKANEVPPIE